MNRERRAERTEPRRASPGRTLAVAAVFAATLVAATVSWVQVVTHLRNVTPLETRGTPAAIVWSERVFRSEAEFARWLRGRGLSYERWVRTHPKAVAILRKRDRAAAAQPAPRSQPARGSRPARTGAVDTAPREAGDGRKVSLKATVVSLAVLLAATLAIVVALGAAVRSARRSRGPAART